MDFIGELLNMTCETVRRSAFAPASTKDDIGTWIGSEGLDKIDMKNLETEFGGNRESEFDPLHIRQKAWRDFKEGRIDVCVFRTSLAKFVVFLPDPDKIQAKDIPISLWSQIINAFSPPSFKQKAGGVAGGVAQEKIRVYLVASALHREFPKRSPDGKKIPIGPENINGGYCYPCRETLAIYIFRAEDATRVLIHELLHAFCTDRFEVGLELVEARTEAWAEFIWCCFLAKGSVALARKYFLEQVAWVLGQNREVANYIGESGVERKEFPWRYTIGKDAIFRRWLLGVLPKAVNTGNSLRLTNPYIVSRSFSGESAKLI